MDIRSKRHRDSQQWIFDYVVKESGQVQNFENETRNIPKGVKSYKMIPKLRGEEAKHKEAIARNAEARGYRETAEEMYWRACEDYRDGQHTIFEDDHPAKLELHAGLCRCYEHIMQLTTYPIERIEVPFEGSHIQILLHLLPDRCKAPLVLHVPGMDQTKEVFPYGAANPLLQRGMHCAVMDGPGQGMSNIRKIRVTDDNYEKAGKAVIDYLLTRPEVDGERLGVSGVSMGSFWAPRIASYDSRVKALATFGACFAPKVYIFNESSPRFKQVFLYMAGMTDDEDAFDAMADRMVLTGGYAANIRCPSLFVTGEFDQLGPVEYAKAVFDELGGPKELWVLENCFHSSNPIPNLGGVACYMFLADWLRDKLEGKYDPNMSRMVYVRQGSDGPYESPFPADYPWRW